MGYIHIWSNQAEGDIYVDGNYEAITDNSQYIAISTTPGYHNVEIYKDGYDKYSTSVYVYSDQWTYVIADLISNQTNWMLLVSGVLAIFLIVAIVLFFPKSKESVQKDKPPQKYKTPMIALIIFLRFLVCLNSIKMAAAQVNVKRIANALWLSILMKGSFEVSKRTVKGTEIEAAILANETNRKINRINPKTAIGMKIYTPSRALMTPSPVATPFPPLNSKKTGYIFPSIVMAATMIIIISYYFN